MSKKSRNENIPKVLGIFNEKNFQGVFRGADYEYEIRFLKFKMAVELRGEKFSTPIRFYQIFVRGVLGVARNESGTISSKFVTYHKLNMGKTVFLHVSPSATLIAMKFTTPKRF